MALYRVLTTGIRLVQLILALAITGLAAYVVSWYNTSSNFASPSPLNFLVFTGPFSVLTLVYTEFLARVAPSIGSPLAAIALELLNVIFLFCALIAWADFLSRLRFCQGSPCAFGRLVDVLVAFQFVLWVITTIALMLELFKRSLRNSLLLAPAPRQNFVEL